MGYEALVSHLAKAAEKLLSIHGNNLKRIAEMSLDRIFFVGAFPFYGVALGSHVKVQEITDGQVIGRAEDTLGLRPDSYGGY